MSRSSRTRSLLAVKRLVMLLVAVAACGANETLFGPDAASWNLDDAVAVELEAVERLDLLFVIDDTGDMKVSQEALAASFGRLLDDIGDETSLHIGVVSSDMGIGGFSSGACQGVGDDGRLQNAPAAGACTPPSGYFISRERLPGGAELKNYIGTLEDTFGCIAQLGNQGCGFEQHLAAMEAALDERNPENSQFLREDSWLGVVILADEDDCSADDLRVFDPSQDDLDDPLGPFASFRCTEFGVRCGGPIRRTAATYADCAPMPEGVAASYLWHPAHHVELLRQQKKGAVVAIAIAGDPAPFGVEVDLEGRPRLEPSCGTTDFTQLAAPGVRLAWFAEAFGAQGAFSSICQDDLSPGVDLVGAELADALADPCITTAIDLTDRSDTPGLQLSCEVTANGAILPACDLSDDGYPLATAARCWWAETDNGLCPGATLHVENAARDVTLTARCLP